MKIDGWEERLIKYVSDAAQTPFRPGKMDCGLFFGGAVLVMTGEDIDSWLRGKYRTIESALELLRDRGFESHVEYVASLFEEHEHPVFAQRGDGAVVTDMDGHDALGVVQGEYVYVMGLSGLGLVPLTEAKRAFKI